MEQVGEPLCNMPRERLARIRPLKSFCRPATIVRMALQPRFSLAHLFLATTCFAVACWAVTLLASGELSYSTLPLLSLIVAAISGGIGSLGGHFGRGLAVGCMIPMVVIVSLAAAALIIGMTLLVFG